MASIFVNGILTDLAEITGTELADKITVRGGAQGVEAFVLGGADLVEIEANNEEVDTTMRGGEGNDVIVVTAGDPEELEWVGTAAINGQYIGGLENDSITMGDGLAILQGSVKGNEGIDTVTVARADGGFINGGSENDVITLGFAEGYGPAAGSRAEASISASTIYGGAENDDITIGELTSFEASVAKGQDGDDTITVTEGATGSGNLFQGNKGDDEINIAKLVGEGNVGRGGKGDDTIRGGNGQDVYGDLGGDLFSVEAEGGMHIKDYGRKYPFSNDGLVDTPYGEDEYPCDDQIQIDGHKIFYTTNEYCVDTHIESSASSFKGNLIAQGFVNSALLSASANAFVSTEIESDTTAKAVAHVRILTDTAKDAKSFVADELTYGDRLGGKGITNNSSTFKNGLFGQTDAFNNNNATIFNSKDAMRGGGIGFGYAYAEGKWTTSNIKNVNGVDKRVISGEARTIIAQTYKNLFGPASETFNFDGDLIDFSQTSDRVERFIEYTQIIAGTITNHWASYKVTKEQKKTNLYELNFGTALFKSVTTGKVYQKVDGQPLATPVSPEFYDSHAVFATATAEIEVKKNPFQAWKENYTGTGSSPSAGGRSWNQILIDSKQEAVTKNGLEITQTARVLLNTAKGLKIEDANTYSSDAAKIGFFSGKFQTKGKTVYDSLVTLGSKAITDGVFTIDSVNNVWRQFGSASSISSPNVASYVGNFLASNELLASTLRNRGLLTLSTTAIFGDLAAPGNRFNNNTLGTKVVITRGTANTDRSFSEFITGTGKLGIKIYAEDYDADQSAQFIPREDGFTKELTGADINLEQWPGFPEVGSSGNGSVQEWIDEDRLVDAANVDDSQDPIKQFLLWAGENNLQSKLNIGSTINHLDIITSNYDTRNGIAVNQLNVFGGNQGFFSASTFQLGVAGMTDFGKAGIAKIALDQGIASSKVTTLAPFRVLFFDNDMPNNGLYIHSGYYGIEAGKVEEIFDETPSVSSAMGGKHTIVTIEGKSAPVGITDINLV